MNAKGAPLKLQLDFVLEDYRKTEVTGAAIGDKVEQLSSLPKDARPPYNGTVNVTTLSKGFHTFRERSHSISTFDCTYLTSI